MIQSPLPAKRAHWWPRSQFPCVSQASSHRVCGIKSPLTLHRFLWLFCGLLLSLNIRKFICRIFLMLRMVQNPKTILKCLWWTGRWSICPVTVHVMQGSVQWLSVGHLRSTFKMSGKMLLAWGIGNMSPSVVCSFMTITWDACRYNRSHYTRKNTVQKCALPTQTRRGGGLRMDLTM